MTLDARLRANIDFAGYRGLAHEVKARTVEVLSEGD